MTLTGSLPGTDAIDGQTQLRLDESIGDAAWDRFVGSRSDASAYHYSGWMRLIGRAFGHEVRPLAVVAGDAVAGVLPLIVMRSHLFGTHAVSLPFLNRGGVLAATPAAAAALLEAAAQVARGSGARYLELRHVERVYPSLTERRHKVAMTLALHDTVEGQWQSVDRKVRNLVRKGEKNGLRFSEGGLELVPTFYEVFARNMRDLGTPVFPQALFGQVMATFPEHSRVLCVHHGALPVAVAITHRRGPWLEVIWASTVREANALAANMFLYWRMISYAIGVGCRTFEFGRCTPGEGTFHFKRQWGAEPSPLVWEYWTGGAPPTFDIDQNAGGYGRAAAIWRRLPLELTNRLGPRIVRGIPC